MATWVYRATQNAATQEATIELLLDHHFLCRTLHGTNGRIANVATVAPEDTIHVVFSQGGDLESLGSFTVVVPDEGRLVDGTNALSRVDNDHDAELIQALNIAGYRQDPQLRAYTGWHLDKLEDEPIWIDRKIFTNNNALWRWPAEQTAKAGIAARIEANEPAGPSASDREYGSRGGGSGLPDLEKPSDIVTLGIDWSGARRAGRKIWAAFLKGGRLTTLCRPFENTPAIGDVIGNFGQWLNNQEFTVAGCDFCFGVAQAQLPDPQQQGFYQAGPTALGNWLETFDGPNAFRDGVRPEARRYTDRDRCAPFAPTNLRMYRQTYYGLRALSGVDPNTNIRIMPWGGPIDHSNSARFVVEVLPAHIVRRIAGHFQYKGRRVACQDARERLLTLVCNRWPLIIADGDANTIVNDVEGDAMDAVLAAIAAAAAYEAQFPIPNGVPANCEGWIYSIPE